MSDAYSRDMIKISVVKILQTIGWHSINTAPLEILTDVLSQYIFQLGKATNEYASEFGFVEPNLDHLGLAFRDYHVNLSDLEEYVTYVNFGHGPTPVPKYPLPKEDHLNFLKPGSQEVVTRPVYIHEHLPPMFPLLEAAENDSVVVKTEEQDSNPTNENTSPVFKKPAELSPVESFKRPRLLLEEEGRPTREISSVMMTTSGFLSPAREGKLPESRTPLTAIEPVVPPITTTSPMEINKRPPKVIKKVERKKDKVGKELFKGDERPKKSPTMKDVAKEVAKLKQKFAGGNPTNPQPASNFMFNNDLQISPLSAKPPQTNTTKISKALVAARQKTERLNTTITPIPMKPATTVQNTLEHVDKLFTEPDKKKVNILKKISNVKNEKLENKLIKIKEEIKQESRESSPDLIIDETAGGMYPKVPHISNDITIELIQCPQNAPSPHVEKPEKMYFDNDSPPGTPSTPKTPEIIASPPQVKEKRKRKDKSKVKKVQKISPMIMDDPMDLELERPKTPEAQLIMKPDPSPIANPAHPIPFPFLPNFGGPGLIPPLNLKNPLYSSLAFPPLMHGFGQTPYMPPTHPGIPMNLIQPKVEEPPTPQILEKPLTPTGIVEATSPPKVEKKVKEHKKEKKEKIKKKNKKDKLKSKAEKKKLKEEKKDKIKKEKKDKRKDKEMRDGEASVPKLTLKLGPASPCAIDIPDTRKLNIKPVVKKEDESVAPPVEIKRELTPELAKFSALVTGQPKPKSMPPPVAPPIKEEAVTEEPTSVPLMVSPRAHGPGRPRIHPLKMKPTKPNKQQLPAKDSEGNEVWICPACGRQDDGSPMIGCDDCDAWYHWVCVGIQIPPDANEDWYCRDCIVKKQEALQTDKKKKRKKREKKEH